MFDPVSGPWGSQESWGMFALTGNPAYYMLYNRINAIDMDLELDGNMAEEEKQRR